MNISRKNMLSADEQFDILKFGCTEIIEEKELKDKLSLGRPLRIKFGADPSAPDIHLGHVVVLDKLRRFGELGHKIIFIIGDFTARIGDPSGRSKTRPVLSKEQIEENSKTYQNQIFRILDKKYTQVVHNSGWLEKINLMKIFELSSMYTVARMLERRDFKERFRNNIDISGVEFLYPLLQGYDSAHLKADVEIGGNDQIFNLLLGRTIQHKYGQAPQAVMTLPLLNGLDGVKKMSKSYGNYIGLDENPEDIYGKVMSASDSLMYEWAKTLSFVDSGAIEGSDPRRAKAVLAHNITGYICSKEEADAAAEHFEKVIVKKGVPEDVGDFLADKDEMTLSELVFSSGGAPSKTRARQLIEQGAVSLDGEVLKNFREKVEIKDGMLLKAGKRFFVKIRKGK
ncbi:MAG: tyrosine--tRNA ligase [Elusimicrobiota bacterium]|nr:tyrosine--tRNA ligase [Elusimicrobiota bacterium]